MSQKGNTLLIVLILVLVAGLSGYYLYTRGYFGQKVQMALQNSAVGSYLPPVANGESGSVTSSKMTLTITSPKNGATLTGLTTTVTGKTSPKADVFVNDQETTADANGNFTINLTLDEGQNDLAVTANDADGNVVEQDLSVNVQSF